MPYLFLAYTHINSFTLEYCDWWCVTVTSLSLPLSLSQQWWPFEKYNDGINTWTKFSIFVLRIVATSTEHTLQPTLKSLELAGDRSLSK